MRRFSDKEKQIIRSIVTHYNINPNQYVLVNAYNDIFYAKKVKFDSANGGQLIFYRKESELDTADDLLDISNEILEISLLIKYLVSNDLIYEIDTNSVNRLTGISGFTVDKDDLAISMDIDPLVSSILLDSLNHRIFVSETLKVLVEDDFKTTEDKLLEDNRLLYIETRELNENTIKQIKETDYQTQVTIALHKQSVIQSEEAKRLADEAQKQTQEAIEQTSAAKEQAKESRKQTRFSIIAVVLSAIAIICSYCVARYVTMEVKVTEEQYSSVTNKLDSLNNNTEEILKHSTDTINTFVSNLPKEPMKHSTGKASK